MNRESRPRGTANESAVKQTVVSLAPITDIQPVSKYRDAAQTYRAAGWLGVLPVRYGAKKSPPKGYTGHEFAGTWPSNADIRAWSDNDRPEQGGGNLALRLPDDILGIDVDNYDAKPGAQTLAAHEAQLGALPPTWRTTSRTDGVSGIRLFRVPAGLTWPQGAGAGIDLVHHGIRYAMAWPSRHPDGPLYRWVRPDGTDAAAGVVPTVVGLPLLPEAWVRGLTGGQASAAGDPFADPSPFAPAFELPGVIRVGDRDTIAHRAACSMQARGLSQVEALVVMEHLAFPRMEQPPGNPFALTAALAKVTRAYDQYGDHARTATTGAAGEDEFSRRVQAEAAQLRVREAAKELIASEKATGMVLPVVKTLTALLAEPDEVTAYRIDRLLPAGGRALLAAAFKAGKSTMVANLIRALVDGGLFLGQFRVEQATRVVLIDDEMGVGQLRRWLRDQGIVNVDRVHVISLRGNVASFDITTPAGVARWAEHLRGSDVLIFDCLRPVMDALGLDEHRDAGRFLVPFDALLAQAGIAEAVLVHHMGHAGERSRGDSRLRDWPDAEWRLVREQKGDNVDPSARRFFTAYGRDVDVAEQALEFDPATRHLSLVGGNRTDTQAADALLAVLAVLAEPTGSMSGNAIETTLKGSAHTREAIRSGLRAGIRDGRIERFSGPNRSMLHRRVS